MADDIINNLVLNDSLAFITVHINSVFEQFWFDIWVMNEKNGTKTWSKKSTIQTRLYFEQVIGFWKDYFVMKWDEQLMLCNPTEKKFKMIFVDRVGDDFQFVNFTESIVSVKGLIPTSIQYNFDFICRFLSNPNPILTQNTSGYEVRGLE